MIVLTRLNGSRFGINDEQIERLEDGPNTVVVLVNGNRYTVLEPMDEVIDAIVEFRAHIIDVGSRIDGQRQPRRRDASITIFRSPGPVDEKNHVTEIDAEGNPVAEPFPFNRPSHEKD